MNNLIRALELFEFEQIGEGISYPLVVHSVPGSGKTSLIRSLIKLDRSFEAFTAGVADTPNLEGCYIKPYSPNCQIPRQINILDEYLSIEDWSKFQVLFSDPYQNLRCPLEASFICKRTKRFGRNTCAYLQKYGFEVRSDLEDTLVRGSPFSIKVEGLLLCFGKAAVDLAVEHKADFKLPCEVRGLTVEVVTLLKSEEPNSENKHLFYVGCTRHSKKLIILE
ncbi:TGB1 [Grapevine foveavirus A]|uniref:TGB1 n=1 Tax=Grapevine foveavirus A TaxID=2763538 RepID=A0A7D4WZJ6_9VIRU|nr:TGB1 [Grapevine foveavirus A]QKV50510.1 TGB1 [Grapevine foveavirus A]